MRFHRISPLIYFSLSYLGLVYNMTFPPSGTVGLHIVTRVTFFFSISMNHPEIVNALPIHEVPSLIFEILSFFNL